MKNDEVSKSIRAAMGDKGVSISGLARTWGLELRYTRRVINGDIPLSVRFAVMLSETLGCDPRPWLRARYEDEIAAANEAMKAREVA